MNATAAPHAQAARWYFLIGSRESGPYDPGALARLLQNGSIHAHTAVRSVDQAIWQELAQVPELARLVADKPSTAPAALPVRPWHRLGARLIDLLVATLAVVAVIGPTAAEQLHLLDSFLAVTAAWLLLEVGWLSVCGQTPGRWLLRCRVVDLTTGGPPAFGAATRRTLRLWAHGMALFIPVFFAAAAYVAYGRLGRDETTRWDLDAGTEVLHQPAGALRGAIAVILVAVYLAMGVFGNMVF